MQTFFVGLLLAAISATSIVAFRHPHGYARLFPYLLIIVSTLFAALTLWQVAVELTWRGLDEFLDPGQLDRAAVEKGRLSLPYPWVVLSYLAWVAFFWINLRLPAFLRVADDGDDDGIPSD